MTLVLLYLAGLGAIAARWLARQQLTAKPWLISDPVDPGGSGISEPARRLSEADLRMAKQATGHRPGAGPPAVLAPGREMGAAKLGLGVFLAAVGLLFALLIAAYGMRVPPGSARIPVDPRLLWLSTGLLAVASLALHGAGAAERRGDSDGAQVALRVAAVAGVMFLGGQGLAWRLLWEAGLGRTADAAGSFFYLITALHGLHLAGGIAALGLITLAAQRAGSRARVSGRIDLCILYWDALLAIWLVVFGFLFRTPWSGLIDAVCRPV
ncbi:cytochrome c oxidase subunit 3 [Methylobacterium sp. WSM2598]|uniref:cytochrome c oxidase subunit 3 n=1 Tax=Methylobacterium sp. WSM2598 TaxID=398261 RepID=UPI00036CE46D|nr:cytochrome c oxidase subunit 3 [Methylobacterium sp. WSM2598]